MAKLLSKPISQPPLLQLEPFAGIDLSVTPTQIDDHHSPDMLNINIDERGALNKRTGYTRIIPYITTDKINGMTIYTNSDSEQEFIFASGTKLYKANLVEPYLATWDKDDLSLTWEGEL